MSGREGYRGTGPGVFTPDGCAVDLYLRLPLGKELEVIRSAAAPGASILELGCGTGRVTHPLVQSGFAVTAVDESAEMLAHVRGARVVRSSIETLDLGERFDVVLLGSCLVHNADPLVQRGLLETCARHVEAGGSVLIQREGRDWHTRAPWENSLGDGVVRVVSSTEVGAGVQSVHVEYQFPDATWTQTFLSRPLTDVAFDAVLAQAGLTVDAWLNEERTWAKAVSGQGL